MSGSEVPTDVVGRAVRLLVLVGEHPHGITLSALARAGGVPVSTAHRLVNSLCREGLVEFETDGKRYKPGLGLFRLGQQAGQVYGFAGTALPVMQRVTRQTEEATLKNVHPFGIFAIHPPGEIQQQLLKHALQKQRVSNSATLFLDLVNTPRGPGMDRRVHIAKRPLVSR